MVCPFEPIEAGSVFVAEISIDAGVRALGSYSVNLLYDPTAVAIRDVAGGSSSAFAAAPTTNPGSFETGTTLVAAANETGTPAPAGVVSVAAVALEVRASAGQAFNFVVSPTSARDSAGQPLDLVSGACAVLVAEPTRTPTAVPTPTPTPVPPRPCTGDCSLDGAVTVDEIITGVAIALGERPVDDCLPFDNDGDDQVTVTEIVAAVNASLVGCPEPPASPTPTVTATATATPIPNLPPILPSPVLYQGYPGEPIAFRIDARDPEGGRLTYEAASVPAGASFDPALGLLSWTPGTDQAGPHYLPFTVTDDGVVPESSSGQVSFQIPAANACNDVTCDPATGCARVPLPLEQTCCVEEEVPPRVAYADVGCPEGAVVFAGRNVQTGIGRLEDCDWLRVLNFAQVGAAVRLNFETRCLRREGGIRLRVRIEAPSRLVVDDDVTLTFFEGENGYLERVTVPFSVRGAGPFFDLEFAEATLSVIASDAFGNSARTDKRVRLTFEPLPDLEDPFVPAP